MGILLNNVCKSFDGKCILDKVNLDIPKGARIALMGPSGCGKTTLVRMIAGLEKPDQGTVTYSGALVFSCHFQENRLLPWYTVEKNLKLILPESVNTARWLEKAGMGGSEKKMPAELSGGMKRRVSLLRALLFPSDVLILDEPYKEMDDETARRMVALTEETIGDRTLILVTHQKEQGDILGCSPVDVKQWVTA